MSKKTSIFQQINNIPYGYTDSFKLFDAAKNSKDIIQRLRLQVKIPAHNGCVNSICWNESGKLLLSGSDDKHLSITDAYSHLILSYIQTGHRSNIFSAKFLPSTSDHKVVSCSGDGVIIYSDLEVPETSMQNKFSCHFGTAYEIMTIPNDPNTFLSCGEDGMVRWFDLRTKTSCSKDNCKEDVLINCHCGVTSLAINPVTPYQLAVGCADSTIRVLDRRVLGTQATGNSAEKKNPATIATFSTPQFTHPTHRRRITSLCYNQDGQEMLVSYSSDYIYLFNVKNSFNKDPQLLTANGNAMRKGRSLSPSRPLMKRLRVRGDWSDTGPQARPESDNSPRSLHANLMQRMSDVLTSMYNRSGRTQPNTSSSSFSGESEMDSDESEVAGQNNSSRNAEPSTDQQSTAAPTPDSHVSDVAVDCTMVETDPTQNPPSSSAPFPEAGIDLSCTTIEVNPPAASISNDTEAEPSGEKALNLSLRNLRQEMSMNMELSDVNERQETPSDATAMDASAISDSKEQVEIIESSNDHCPIASSSDTVSEQSSISHIESTDSDCDKGPSKDALLSNPSTDVCDVPNSTSDTNIQLSQNTSCDNTTELIPPCVVIENSSGASNPEPEREGQGANRDERNMTLVMEVDAWDVDSDDDQRSGPQSPPPSFDSRRTPDIETIFEVAQENDDELVDALTQPDVIQRYIGHRNARTMEVLYHLMYLNNIISLSKMPNKTYFSEDWLRKKDSHNVSLEMWCEKTI